MEKSKADTIAHLLGLTKDGCPSTLRMTDTLEVAREGKQMVGSLIEEFEDGEVFSEEFGSQYLPSLARTFLALGPYPSDHSDHPMQHTYISYSDVIVLVAISVTVVEILDQVVLTKHVPDTSDSVASILMTLIIMFTTLANQLPPTATFPSLPLKSRQTLRTLRALLLNRELPELAEALTSLSGTPTNNLCTILSRMSAEETDSIRASSWGITSVWRSCEHLLAADRKGEPERSNCVQLKDGKEMMACLRCIAVRYCSKEHQKADWKRHKLFCFKPSW